jgi:UDP-N-acetylmuramoyl-L-alanyl-D-glutamate--2,6-diaminopimelate ligase
MWNPMQYKISLSTLLQNICLLNNLNYEVKGLAQNSRLVQPGDLFLACKGRTFDGRLYIEEAIRCGATAVLAEADGAETKQEWRGEIPVVYIPGLTQFLPAIAERFYDFPARKLKIIGITGTNGKTSCSHFMAQALQTLNQTAAVIGTLGKGVLGCLQETLMTTPDTVTLQKTFAEFTQQKIQYVAMEVSSHSLDQRRVSGIDFAASIFTNLTQDHLDYHRSMEDYGEAKKRLFTEYAVEHSIINADDEFGQKLIAILPPVKVITYGYKQLSDVYVRNVKFNLSGICAWLVTPWGEGEFVAPLIGEFNLSNILAVAATLGSLGFSIGSILSALANLKSVPGRMQILAKAGQPSVVIDYAHTPDALEKALKALRKHCQGKLYCIFGCGGDRDKGKRPIMGGVAEKYADQAILTNDNPRHEDPQAIIHEILGGFGQKHRVLIESDRSKAIQDIIQCAGPEDYVLVAGKGAEAYQQIGDTKLPFSDEEVVLRILES